MIQESEEAELIKYKAWDIFLSVPSKATVTIVWL